ncbi:MAG: pyocin knob domain-containing protein [Limosilactobacillus mucosae]
MERNIIKFNINKLERGGLLVDMYDQFNARVGDQGTPLVIQWTQGAADTPINLQKNQMHFYATGQVGKYLEKLDDGTGYKMSADASSVEYEDKDSAGTQANGITVAKLPKQFFPQEGIFYGYFGLKDASGNTYTSTNVWFRVLGGVPIMGAAIPYFSTRFDELMETCQGRIEDALAQLRQEYQDEVKKKENLSTEMQAALSKVADEVGAIQAQIDAGNVVTLIQHNADIKRTSEMIENKLAQMSLTPEAFANSDAIKAAYPNGKTGIMVAVDTGHKWIWFNDKWNDCGVYQSMGIAKDAVTSMKLVTPDQANGIDANTVAGDTIYRLLNTKGATDIAVNTPFGNEWKTNGVCLLLTIGESATLGTVQFFINTGDDTIYHRTYISDTTGAHWSSWKFVNEDELVSNPEMVTPSNSGSFDFDSAQNNSVVRILLDSTATIPAHAPFKTYPGGIGILETYGSGLGAVQKYTQVYKDMAQDTSVWYRYKAKDWYSWYQANAKATTGNGKLKITVGSGKDFTKLKDAVEAAMSSTPANTEVVVYPGTYDLVQEFGEDYFNNISGGELNGLMIGKGLTLTFLSGSHVTANYTGTNPNVMKGFSPFNATEGDIYIKGLDLTCSRVRYGFHDERASNPNPYTTHLRDCQIYMDNTQNTAWSPRQCIGGGLGEHGTISIGRCSFESKDISGGVVSYHNGSTADCESTITIFDSYFGGSSNANVGFGYRGSSKHATTINLIGNSWTSAPNVHPETPSETNVNMKLGRVFNNELRTV